MSYSEEDKLIFKVDQEYKPLFRKIIKSKLLMYPGIPTEWEDIYVMFLKEVQKHADNYNPDDGIPFHTYLGSMCKFFTLNECRRLSTQKFKVLNNSVPLDAFYSLEDPSTRVEIDLDLSEFSKIENSVYHLYFILEKNMRELSQELDLSMHKVTATLKAVKLKILTQLRN